MEKQRLDPDVPRYMRCLFGKKMHRCCSGYVCSETTLKVVYSLLLPFHTNQTGPSSLLQVVTTSSARGAPSTYVPQTVHRHLRAPQVRSLAHSAATGLCPLSNSRRSYQYQRRLPGPVSRSRSALVPQDQSRWQAPLMPMPSP